MARRSLWGAILLGGVLGGALDLLFAVSFAHYNGAAASKVFQAIASGLIGRTAQAGGPGVAALGVACHFALSVGWAAVFAAVANARPVILRHRAAAAVAFGVVVFLVMRLVVLPLSAYPGPVTFKPLATVLDLLSHMFLFAAPIVVLVGRAVDARTRHDPSAPTPPRGVA